MGDLDLNQFHNWSEKCNNTPQVIGQKLRTIQ